MVRSASSRNKKNAKDSFMASPLRRMKPLPPRTFASANSPAQLLSSTTLHLGLLISAKVCVLTFHSHSLLTDANVNRSLGEILHRGP